MGAQRGGGLRREVEAPVVRRDQGAGIKVVGGGVGRDGHFDPLAIGRERGDLTMQAVPCGDRALEGEEDSGGAGECEPERPDPCREGGRLTCPGEPPREVRLLGRFR